ncbi:hypothetical protein AB4Z29_21515 [Paenibacillus sp. 2TAB23]|uniref:hypothetical protein n=1 Tax=Paenibacillus sp. 2TAB23 TaxID=3233004 RepID=UPI003F9AECB8
MNHLDLYELEYLFECEASLIEEGIPWVYGDAKFSLARENREIDFIIGIASRCGEVIMRVDQRSLLQLTLENIDEILIFKEQQSEGISIKFVDGNYVRPLTIHTKPEIRITWGTSLELQR